MRRFKNCRGKWHFASPLRLNKVPRRTRDFFLRGRVWHEALAYYYDNLSYDINIVEAFEQFLIDDIQRDRNAGGDWTAEEVNEMLSIGTEVLGMYPLWAEKNLDHKWQEIVDVEVGRTVPLVDDIGFSLRADMVVRRNNKLWIVDFKTTKSLPEEQMFLDFDEQITGYLKALEIVYKEPVIGAMFVYLWYRGSTEPVELQRGGLSTAKNQIVTPQRYFDKLVEIGEDPREYRKFLKHLQKREWFRVFEVRKTRDEKEWLWRNHQQLALTMTDPDVEIYYSPSPMNCNMCSYQGPCLSARAGKDFSRILEIEYTEGKEW